MCVCAHVRHSYSWGDKGQVTIILQRGPNPAFEASKHLLSSSDPHQLTFYTMHIYIDITYIYIYTHLSLSWRSIGILSGILFEIYSGSLSGIYPNILSLSGIYPDILFGILSDILCGVFSGILRGIHPDILSELLSGVGSGPCMSRLIWSSR